MPQDSSYLDLIGLLESQLEDVLRQSQIPVVEAPLTRSMYKHHPAILGIDLGTTAIRAAIMSDGLTLLPNTISRPKVYKQDPGTDCDFRSLALPFRINDPVSKCLVAEPQGDEICLPIKCTMYVVVLWMLRNEPEGRAKIARIMASIPQIRPFHEAFLGHSEDKKRKIVVHLMKIFVHHLTVLRASCVSLASVKGMRVIKLMLAAPPNWDKLMCKLYARLVQYVWGEVSPENIHLICESKAACHWVIDSQQVRFATGQIKQLVVVDFGGHTLNVSSFVVKTSDDGKDYSFCTTADSLCSHGGSEYYGTLVRERLLVEANRQGHVGEQRDNFINEAMQSYRVDWRPKVNGGPIHPRGAKDKKSDAGAVKIGEPFCSAMFRKAFEKPLGALSGYLKDIASQSTDVLVLLSGGTFENQYLYERAVGIIEEAGLMHNRSLNDTLTASAGSSAVCQGAVMALQTQPSARDFISTAAFALNTKTGQEIRKIPVIMHNGQPREQEISIPPSTSGVVYICCCPMSSDSDAEKMERNRAYEFHQTYIRPGRHKMHLTYDSSDGDYLVLSYRPANQPRTSWTTYRWPVYLDPSHRVLFVDIDKQAKGEEDDGEKALVKLLQRSRVRRHRARGFADAKIWRKQVYDDGAILWQDTLPECHSSEDILLGFSTDEMPIASQPAETDPYLFQDAATMQQVPLGTPTSRAPIAPMIEEQGSDGRVRSNGSKRQSSLPTTPTPGRKRRGGLVHWPR